MCVRALSSDVVAQIHFALTFCLTVCLNIMADYRLPVEPLSAVEFKDVASGRDLTREMKCRLERLGYLIAYEDAGFGNEC